LSIIRGPFSVAPCQTLVSRFATFASLYHLLDLVADVLVPQVHLAAEVVRQAAVAVVDAQERAADVAHAQLLVPLALQHGPEYG
jgi:hypothetical protein